MTLPKIFVTRPANLLPEEAVTLLEKHCSVEYLKDENVTKEELYEIIADKEGIFWYAYSNLKLNKIFSEKAKAMKVVSTVSAGYDHIDLEEMKSRNIKVGYTPGVLSNAVADLTIGLLLATSRRFFEANRSITSNEWSFWPPMWMTGQGLQQSTVGIFGLGGIGKAVLKRLQAFDVAKCLYCNRSPRSLEETFGAEKVSFDKLLKESDFVIVTSAYNEDTHHIFNENAFNKMKKNAIIINTSRGGLIDQDALIKAVNEKKIAGAGLDVMTPEPISPDHPLTKIPNITILPHIGSAEVQTRIDMAVLAAKNLICGLQNKPMPSPLC